MGRSAYRIFDCCLLIEQRGDFVRRTGIEGRDIAMDDIFLILGVWHGYISNYRSGRRDGSG